MRGCLLWWMMMRGFGLGSCLQTIVQQKMILRPTMRMERMERAVPIWNPGPVKAVVLVSFFFRGGSDSRVEEFLSMSIGMVGVGVGGCWAVDEPVVGPISWIRILWPMTQRWDSEVDPCRRSGPPRIKTKDKNPRKPQERQRVSLNPILVDSGWTLTGLWTGYDAFMRLRRNKTSSMRRIQVKLFKMEAGMRQKAETAWQELELEINPCLKIRKNNMKCLKH